MTGTARRAAAVAVVVVTALTVPAGAAPVPTRIVVTDPSGDANAVNSQGGRLPLPDSTVLPVSVGTADLVSLELSHLTHKVRGRTTCDGLRIVLTMAADVADQTGLLFRLLAAAVANDIWFVGYDTTADRVLLQHRKGGENFNIVLPPAVVSGRTVTITVPQKVVLQTGEKARGKLFGISADTRVTTGSSFPVLIDKLTTEAEWARC